MRTLTLALLALALPPAAAAQQTCLSGDCENGQGSARFGPADGDHTRYTGPFRDGQPHGSGSAVSSGGETYVGEFRDGRMHGQGTYTWPNGSVYTGAYVDGHRHGQGTLTLANGWTYTGPFANGDQEGVHLATHTNGQQERVRFVGGDFVEVVERLRAPGGGPVSGGDLALGRSIAGTIADGDATVALTASDDSRHADPYTLSLAPGDEVTVRMESTSFDTYLKVVRGAEFIARNDDFGSTAVSQLTFTASEGGTYTVYAGTFTEAGRGAYTLRATRADRPAGKAGASGAAASGPADETVVQGSISNTDAAVPLPLSDEPRKADAHLVALDRGQTLVVEMTSDDFDTYLRVERDGVKLAHNDDAGSTSRSFLEYTADRAGIVTVYAGTFHEAGRGDYTLRYHVE